MGNFLKKNIQKNTQKEIPAAQKAKRLSKLLFIKKQSAIKSADIIKNAVYLLLISYLADAQNEFEI